MCFVTTLPKAIFLKKWRKSKDWTPRICLATVSAPFMSRGTSKALHMCASKLTHTLSNLMRLMVGTLRLEAVAGVPFPPLDAFRDAGYLTFEQLASLRHRGAFSTVSLTFATCCQLTQRLPHVYADISGSENLLREWYQVRPPRKR